jgi:hypothetical protein
MKSKKVKRTKGIRDNSELKGYRYPIMNSGEKPGHRLFIATPARGYVRMEWALARFGQIIPTNWQHADYVQMMNMFAPIGYEIADAQNIIVKAFLDNGSEWLFLLEDDVILPPNGFILLNEYIRSRKVPVVSGLYFTKSSPPEPLIYRGRGNSYFTGWKIGDKVWCDGVPTGCLLIHRTILEALWKESQPYVAKGTVQTRRVFEFPELLWFDPEKGLRKEVGTSDLKFCQKLKDLNIFEKAGWKRYSKMEYPLLVDTRLFCKHISPEGKIYPLEGDRY